LIGVSLRDKSENEKVKEGEDKEEFINETEEKREGKNLSYLWLETKRRV